MTTCTALAVCTLWLQCICSGSENHKTGPRVPVTTCQMGKLQTLALDFLLAARTLQRAQALDVQLAKLTAPSPALAGFSPKSVSVHND